MKSWVRHWVSLTCGWKWVSVDHVLDEPRCLITTGPDEWRSTSREVNRAALNRTQLRSADGTEQLTARLTRQVCVDFDIFGVEISDAKGHYIISLSVTAQNIIGSLIILLKPTQWLWQCSELISTPLLRLDCGMKKYILLLILTTLLKGKNTKTV